MNLYKIKKNLKVEITSYKGKVKISFLDNKTPHEGSQCICTSVILIDLVYRTNKNYYSQELLEEYRYIVK